ncbi:hypothetical protein PIIN_09186 [Serendipita indica DSM 11827]|uniref:Uncharacterized protein n=1 Tax=Serendipita indica (strain DSM 11827) TaxID=1109443 RepID=G4TV59_SERID|nr:hypothetical protein PIIN_09186 [Serendipita indica DSM 11827]
MFLVDKPNRVPERQRLYQQSTIPIYLRTPRSRLYVGTFAAGFGVAMLGSVYTMYALIRGKE